MVRYLVRAVKYFLYILILLALVIAALVMFHVVEPNLATMFKNGYNSLWQILVMFGVLALVYPFFGYMKKGALVPGEYSEIAPEVKDVMSERGYVLVEEEGENMVFRRRDFLSRLTRSFEDKLTFTRDVAGFYVEGLRKDVVRIVYAIEYRHNHGKEIS